MIEHFNDRHLTTFKHSLLLRSLNMYKYRLMYKYVYTSVCSLTCTSTYLYMLD